MRKKGIDPVDALLRYPLFALLGRPCLEAWASVGQTVTATMGQTLLEVGTPGKYVFVVLRGRVRVSRPAESGRERSLGVFEPGEVFGEYALLKPQLNTATCRACEPAELFRLPLAILQRGTANHPAMRNHLKSWLRLHAVVNHLRHGEALGFLSGPSMVLLLERCQEIHFKAAHTIQAGGLLANSWLYIQSGEVAIHPGGEEAEPGILRGGECFGERALHDGGELPLALAQTDTVCWRLSREEFLRPLEGNISNSAQTFGQVPPRRTRPWQWLAQRGPSDCGIAALAMTLRGLDLEANLEQLTALTPLGPTGASLAALTQTVHALGLRATAVRLGIEQLPHARLPAVAHLANGHYVSLFEVQQREAVIGDPAEGVKTLPLQAFQRVWSGHLLLLTQSG